MFSLILPVYNERYNLSRNFEKIVKAMSDIGGGYEIIIAEDGSTDGTYSIAKSLSRRFRYVRVSHSDTRLGKGLAIKRAFPLARGDKIGFMDIDLSTSTRHLKEMVDNLDRYDIVVGSRLIRRDYAKRKLKRHAFSTAYNALIRCLFRSRIRDHQCGFKGFRRNVLAGLIKDVKNHRWFFDTEILVIAQSRGYNIKELPVLWRESKESKVRINWVICQMLIDIIRFLLSTQTKTPHQRQE